jgi:hypothetical protein
VGYDDQTRASVNQAFTGILRGSPMAGAVNVQRASLALFTIFEHTETGEPVDLGALYFYLVHEAKAQEGHAIEAMVVLKSREARFPGVTFTLPQACASLSEEQLASIVEVYNSRAAEKAVTAYERKEAPQEHLPPPPTTAAPSKTAKKRPTISRDKAMYVALGVIIFVFVLDFANRRAKAPPPLEEITFPNDSSGLPCLPPNPPMMSGFARCVIPKALWDKEGEEAIRARAEITKNAVKARGVTKLMVVTQEDGLPRLRI